MFDITCNPQAGHTQEITVQQSTTDASVSFFSVPVPLRFYQGGTDTTIILHPVSSPQTFTVALGFEPDSVVFDPECWIISANSHVHLNIPETTPADFSWHYNPTDHLFTLQSPEAYSSLQLRISDLSGRVTTIAEMITKGSGKWECRTGSRAPGIYLFEIYSENKRLYAVKAKE